MVCKKHIPYLFKHHRKKLNEIFGQGLSSCINGRLIGIGSKNIKMSQLISVYL